MFTGLIQATGQLRQRSRRGPGWELTIASSLTGLELGESLSVNGACLTVARLKQGAFAADVSIETAERTTLGRLPLGAAVNLERALRVGDRMGGHWVTGHVDGIARVANRVAAGEALRVEVQVPADVLPFLAPKGSVALDGVSLTVNAISGSTLDVMLIPHTREVTTLGDLPVGRELNLEVDLVARHVVRFLQASSEVETAPSGEGRPGEGQANEIQPNEASLVAALRRAKLL